MSNPRDNIEAKLGLSGPPLQKLRDEPPRIPDHELIRRIGQGAYGEVWLARNTLGTWRAIKIVYRDNFKDARPYEREFAGIRRFEPLSRSNEGFVDILQVGRDEAGGWFYYVMELADDAVEIPAVAPNGRPRTTPELDSTPTHAGGYDLKPDSYTSRTLSRSLAQHGRLPLEDCLQLGLTLTLALGHLHRHGLIHRDVKPSNIIYVGGVPKLADIGLVTEASEANTFVGTEGFVPPEGPTSPQADLYALGKVLYEAAMGKDRHEFPEPFTQIGTDCESIALMELNAVLLRACAPDPRKRYATAEEMHADLALLHSGGSVKRRHQFDRQFQLAKQVGAIAIAATLLVGGALLWQRRQTHRMTRLAGEKSTLAAEKTTLADNLARLGEESRDRLVRLDIANGVRLLDGGDPAGALLWFADALPLLTNNPAQESIHRIRIQQTLDKVPRVSRFFADGPGLITCAASPDGKLLATGTKRGKVRVWKIETGESLWGPKTLGTGSSMLRFSRDGKRLYLSSTPEQLMFRASGGDHTGSATMLDANTGAELHSSAALFPKPASELASSAFSPEDHWLALAERGGTIRIVDLNSGASIRELRGHEDSVRFMSFSPDGAMLASAGNDKTVRLWRLPSGEPIGEPLRHPGPVLRVLFSGDGRHLVTACSTKADGPEERQESEFQVWEVAKGERVGEPIPARWYMALFVAPGTADQFFLQDASHDLQSRRFSAPADMLFKIDVQGGVQCWSFNADGSRVALGTTDGGTRVFDTRDGTPQSDLLRNMHWGVVGIWLDAERDRVLAATDDGSAYLWDITVRPAETLRQTLPFPMQRQDLEVFAEQVANRADAAPFFLSDGKLRLFGSDLAEAHFFKKPKPDTGFTGIVGSRNGGHWVSWQWKPDDRSLFLWRASGAQTVGKILEHPARVLDRVAFTPDEQFVLTLCRDNHVRKWRVADGTLVHSSSPPQDRKGRFVEVAPDGRTALWFEASDTSGAFVNQARFFDLEAGGLIGEWQGFTGTIFRSQFSPDGRHLAVLDLNGDVTILESRTGRMVSNTIRHSINLIWVDWDPTGSRLLTAGHNDEILVWDAVTGDQVFGPLRLPGGAVRVAAWSPDGRFIVARNDNKQARVWDATTGEAITPALSHAGEVAFARMSAARRLVTASYPDQLRAWDFSEASLPPDVLADYARLLSGRRVDASGVMVTLRPEEVAAVQRSLQSRAPRLFE